jgi:hypothetical protein
MSSRKDRLPPAPREPGQLVQAGNVELRSYDVGRIRPNRPASPAPVRNALINAATCRPDLPQVSAQDNHAAGITLRWFRDLFVNADCGEIRPARQQRVGLSAERIDEARASRALLGGRLIEAQCPGQGVARAVEAQRDGAAADFFDFVQTADFRPGPAVVRIHFGRLRPIPGHSRMHRCAVKLP